jgi:hypothetical protein
VHVYIVSHIWFYSTFTLISGALICAEVNWKLYIATLQCSGTRKVKD